MDDFKQDNTASQQDTNAAQDQSKLAAWANNAGGYRLRLGGRPRRPPAKDLFSSIGKMSDSTLAQQPVVQPATTPLPLDLSTVRMKRALKGTADKKTCMLDLGGTTYVVKGGTEQSAAHVEASEFLGKLGLKGVHVPATRLLSDVEKTDLIAGLDAKDPDAKELADSLTFVHNGGGSVGQVSELADGQMLTAYLKQPRATTELIAKEIKTRNKLLAMPLDEAWSLSFADLEEASKKLKTADPQQLAGFRAATDAQGRQAALDWLKTQKIGGGNNTKPVMDRLNDLQAGTLQQGTTALEQQESARRTQIQPLVDFAKKTEGVQAFAGMAVGDLLAGMDDRVLARWNAGNFLFDAQKGQLCCIDNQKEPDMSVSATDPQRWRRFLTAAMNGQASLEDMIFHKVYEPTSQNSNIEDALHNVVDFSPDEKAKAKLEIRQVIDEVMDRIDADPTQGKVAKARVRQMRLQQRISDLLKLPDTLHTPPARPAKLSKSEKLERAAKSGFNRLLSLTDRSRKDYRDKSQAIKDGLRNGSLTPDAARRQLTALQDRQQAQQPAGRQGTLQTDRRSDKIMYLVAGMEFGATLNTLRQDLDLLLLQMPPNTLLDGTAAAMAASLRDVVDAWTAAYAGEPNVANALDRAWSAFPQAFRAAP